MDYLLSFCWMCWWKRCVRQAAPKHQQTQHLETDVRQETARKITNPNPNKRETEMFSNCRMWTTFPHTRSSQSESLLTIFEDTELVIKMIIEGRSPAMRHVSRTHRVALVWLSDILNLYSKIQIKYVDTKNQFADMLTKESFTCDERNRLLRLLNIMNFFLFSCIHFFLSNRKQSAMSKRGQEGTSGECSTMAKPRSSNLVSHNFLSTRKNSPQRLSDSNNPENAKAKQGGVSSSVLTAARHEPKSSRAFFSKATGTHSKCRYFETGKRQVILRTQSTARCGDTHE